MILFLQRFYDPSANTNIQYQEIFTEFIAYQRTQPLLYFADIDTITFDKSRAMVREAVSVAFSHVLSSYDEPVNIARKKYNVSNPSNNKSDRDVNPIDKTMAIPRASLASKAKKPFIKRLRLFSGNKRRSMISKDQASRPLHKNHKSDEIDR
eukprot:742185_1